MRSTRAHIDLAAIAHNLNHARSLAPKSKVMAVVKADAYGHGAIAVARTIEHHSDALAVACLEEALTLREAGIGAPILVLEGLCQAGSLTLAANKNFWLMVHNVAQLKAIENATLPSPVTCWLKVDTGMHRLGFDIGEASEMVSRLQNSPNCHADVTLTTHFACADNPGDPHTAEQLQRFEQWSKPLQLPRSASNSAAVMAWPDAHYDWIRPGYMLYGNSPFHDTVDNARALRPAMTFSCDVIALRHVAKGERVGYGGIWQAERDSVIATLNAGYADGYPRHAKSGTPVIVNGQRACLAGRVSMDMITVDVTDINPVTVGDGAILWGPALPVDEIACWTGTIGYELTTRMPPRTPRDYDS